MSITIAKDIVNSEHPNLKTPEVCRGMGVDWNGYTPTGGWLFHEHFDEQAHKINGFITKLKFKMEEISTMRKNRLAIENNIYNTIVFSNQMKKFAEDSSLEGDKLLAVQRFAEATENLSIAFGNHESSSNEDKDTSRYQTDIDFLNNIVLFFRKDLELDELVYALWRVDIKYKTKLFRNAQRLYSEVMILRDSISHSTSICKVLYNNMQTAFDELAMPYEALGKFIKETKKGLSKMGNEFWVKNKDEMELAHLIADKLALASPKQS